MSCHQFLSDYVQVVLLFSLLISHKTIMRWSYLFLNFFDKYLIFKSISWNLCKYVISIKPLFGNHFFNFFFSYLFSTKYFHNKIFFVYIPNLFHLLIIQSLNNCYSKSHFWKIMAVKPWLSCQKPDFFC